MSSVLLIFTGIPHSRFVDQGDMEKKDVAI